MKANYVLIKALRDTASIIEANPASYNWHNPHKCNCGLLAYNILRGEIKDSVIQSHIEFSVPGYWFDAYEFNVCQETGMSLHFIFLKLEEYGLSGDDFEIIEDIGLLDTDYNYSPNSEQHRLKVVTWMRAKAKELESQLNPIKNTAQQKQSV